MADTFDCDGYGIERTRRRVGSCWCLRTTPWGWAFGMEETIEEMHDRGCGGVIRFIGVI